MDETLTQVWRWVVATLLAVCTIALISMSSIECSRERQREEARMNAYYRELGGGDIEMGRMRHEVRDRVREIRKDER